MDVESNYSKLYNEFVRSNASLREIRNQLLSQNYEENDIDHFINKYISDKSNTRTSRGFKCIMTGSFFLLLSMLLTFFNIIPNMRGFTLYGLTSLGVLVALYGVFLVIEKEQLQE